jgi:hypothetical protein
MARLTADVVFPTRPLLTRASAMPSFRLAVIPSFLPSFMKSVKSFPAGIASVSGTGSPAFRNKFTMTRDPSAPALSASRTR